MRDMTFCRVSRIVSDRWTEKSVGLSWCKVSVERIFIWGGHELLSQTFDGPLR